MIFQIHGRQIGWEGIFKNDLRRRHVLLLLSDLQPFITEKKICQTCDLKEENKFKWNLPLQFYEFSESKFNSIQEYYDWYVGKRLKQHCEVCSEDSLTIWINYAQEPNFLIIEFISTRNSQQKNNKFSFNKVLKNKDTNSQFNLVATINMHAITKAFFVFCL